MWSGLPSSVMFLSAIFIPTATGGIESTQALTCPVLESRLILRTLTVVQSAQESLDGGPSSSLPPRERSGSTNDGAPTFSAQSGGGGEVAS